MKKNLLLIILLVGTIASMLIVAKTGASLKTKETPLGILHLELPFNKLKADSVITTWKTSFDKVGTANIQVAKTNTWWDFLFLIFYSLFLFTAINRLCDNFTGGFGRAGKKLGNLAFVVAALDIAENIGMFQMLDGNVTNGIALFTSICSSIKWLLAITLILYILLMAPLVWYNSVRN